MSGLDCLGTDEIGFDLPGAFGTILQAGGGIAQGAIAAHETDVKQEELDSAEKAKLAKSIAADAAAATAIARAKVSAKLKSPSMAVDISAATTAGAAADRAGAALSSAATDKRAEAADKALDAATADAQKNPKDGYKAALVETWTAIANKAHNTSIVSADESKGGKGGKSKKSTGGESWFTRPVLGPVPGYGVLAGGAGVLGALGYAVKRIFFK
jgi:hypothetical protein